MCLDVCPIHVVQGSQGNNLVVIGGGAGGGVMNLQSSPWKASLEFIWSWRRSHKFAVDVALEGIPGIHLELEAES